MLLEIDTIPGATIDAQLRNTFANRFYITEKSSGKAFNSDQYP